MSAADLANDQDRELTVVTAERDDLKLRLDEAEAVIDAVRKVRLTIVGWINDSGVGRRGQMRRRWLCRVVTLLDQVDGL